jgi:ADP-ribose pyrophosphatase YjhB (NUDIX family)
MSDQRPVRIRPTAAILRDDHILLIEDYDDEDGQHFNLPGGGLEPGESLIEGVKREVLEETSAMVDVGPLVLVFESKNAIIMPGQPGVHTLMPVFQCHLSNGSEPRMPDQVTADSLQVGICWVPLAELATIKLLPPIADDLVACLIGSDLHSRYVMDTRA